MQTETSRKYRFWVYALLIALVAASVGLFMASPEGPDGGQNSSFALPGVFSPDADRPVMALTDLPQAGEVTIPAPETEPPPPDQPHETDANPDQTDPPDAEGQTEPAETQPEVDPDPRPRIPSYPNQLPESPAVPEDYFRDALFIGDSRMLGLCTFTRLPGYCYAQVSLNVKSVLTKSFLETGRLDSEGNPETCTVLEAVKRTPDAFKKVYVSFGVNEYGYGPTVFSSCYEYFLDQLTQVLPAGTPIYVMGIYPVNEMKAAANNYGVKNDRLLALDAALADLCTRLGAHYLNLAEAVNDSGRYDLPADWANDGVHMNYTPIKKIRDYLFTHTAPLPPPVETVESVENAETVETHENVNSNEVNPDESV